MSDSNQILRLTPREMRMMSERIFSLCAMPRGFSLTLSDIPMYSQQIGLGGFDLLFTTLPEMLDQDPANIRITDRKSDQVILDLGGIHSWLGINAVLDLCKMLSPQGKAQLTVVNAAHPAELAVACALAGRWSVTLEMTATSDGAIFTADTAEYADPVLDILNHDGLLLDADLWWQIYETARSALAPDTALSRRHAGVFIINDDGSITGRADNDDDSDVGFLAQGGRNTA